jgi:hypothetical protein
MNAPMIYGNRKVFSASAMLTAVGKYIHNIKNDANLGWADLGVVFGKGDDAATKYANANSEMSLSTFVLGVSGLGSGFGDIAMAYAGYRLTPLNPSDELPPIRRAVEMLTTHTAGRSPDKMGLSDAALLDEADAIDDLLLLAAELMAALARARRMAK